MSEKIELREDGLTEQGRALMSDAEYKAYIEERNKLIDIAKQPASQQQAPSPSTSSAEALLQAIYRAALESSTPSAEHLLGELLAVIHGDGGHHTAKVGLQQSVEDAVKVFHQTSAERAHGGGKVVAICTICKGSGEVIGSIQHPSGNPENDYSGEVPCPECNGTGEPQRAQLGVTAAQPPLATDAVTLLDQVAGALRKLLGQVGNIEVLGENSAMDTNIASSKRVRAKVDEIVAEVRNVLAAYDSHIAARAASESVP